MLDPVNLCIIAESTPARDRLVGQLQTEGYSLIAVDGPSGLETIRERQPQVVLCDWEAPDLGGPDIVQMLRADTLTADCHIILLAEHYDSKACAAGLAAGGDDLFGKDRPFDELVGRIRVGIRMCGLQMDLKQAAITDPLTGLHNRGHFGNVLESEFARSRRYGSRLSLIMLDLDHFKAVNDTYGHQVGDAVLRMVGQRLPHWVREPDTVARYGGEEFIVVAPEATLARAEELAERLRRQLADLTVPEEMEGCRLTASFGVASDENPRVTTADGLVILADQALYAAKRAGRNRVATSDQLYGMGEPLQKQSDEVEHLRRQVESLSIQAKEAYVQSIWSLVQALEARDRYTSCHSQNITFIAEKVAQKLGLSPALTRSVRLAAMLHDIGKIGVPDSVLLKPSELTQEERAILRRVPQLSANIVDHMRILQAELPMIRHQRENYDGTGYPLGLAGDQIPIGSRILMVADAFDSLTSDRVFRPSCSATNAIKEIRRHAGTQFDPRVVEALTACLDEDEAGFLERMEANRQALETNGDPLSMSALRD